MDINVVKNLINGVNLVKKRSYFGKNGENWVILGSKMTSKVKIWENLSKNVTLKVYKNDFCQFYGHIFGK